MPVALSFGLPQPLAKTLQLSKSLPDHHRNRKRKMRLPQDQRGYPLHRCVLEGTLVFKQIISLAFTFGF